MANPTVNAVPRDKNNVALQLVPAIDPYATTYDATISSATSVTLNANTTLIEVNAIDKGVFLKYAAGAASNDFDEFILANTTRHFARPANITVISVIEESATAKVAIIEK